jgi:hypothetical protein
MDMIAQEDWAEDLWERPEPDPVRLARHRLHPSDEPSRYVRHSALLPELDRDTIDADALWMRVLRRASVGR